MKKWTCFFIAFFCCALVWAQKVQTIVPKEPVVVGNAFQLQYIITDPSTLVNIASPSFKDLQLVSGPNRFKGTASVNGKMQPIENIAFTVVPLKTGTISIEGLSAEFKTGMEKSKDATIHVIAQPKASSISSSSYTDINLYAPSNKTDLDRLINENIFIRSDVDKQTCYLGEAIVATFKLYSRLQSTSEVLNSPGLYGFSVMDMLNINEAHISVETINGKVFNTSVLRRIQLYPEQTGKLTIDEMQVQNEIEFLDSSTGKKTKINRVLVSHPIEINVKPLPGKEPEDFDGAVGQFNIAASIVPNKIESGQTGSLVVMIQGEGNFIQITAPQVRFPKAFEVFDPEVADTFNENVVPVKGKREFRFGFTADSVGEFILAPVEFSFFEPRSKKYKSIRTDSIRFELVPASKRTVEDNKKISKRSVQRWSLFLLIPVVAIIFLVMKRRQRVVKKTELVEEPKPDWLSKFHAINSQLNEKQACIDIQKLLTEVLKTSALNKMQEEELRSIMDECRLFAYTDLNMSSKLEELKKRALTVLRQLQ